MMISRKGNCLSPYNSNPRQQFLDRPDVIGESKGLRWRHLDSGMHPAEIEVRGNQDDGPAVVLDFAGEAHCFAGETAIEQSN